MKVHFFVRSLRQDGAGSHQNALAQIRYLKECGHTVVVHALTSFNNPPNDIRIIEHAKEKLGLRAGNAFLTSLLFECEQDADLFFLYGVDCIWGAGRYKKIGGIKPVAVYVDTCMSTMGGQRLSAVYYWKRLVWEKLFGLRDAAWVDAYIAASPFIADTYVAYGFPEEKFSVVPNFFEFDTHTRVSHGARTEILYAGRVTYDKGIDLLIEAAKDLPRDPPWHLRIVGGGPLREACERMVKKYQLQDFVSFTPWVSQEELSAIYESADIFVHPSRIPESFGRAFVEAMAHGIPVIASNIGAAPWTVGEGGIFFPRENISSLREAIISLLQDTSLRERLAQKGLHRAREFSKDVIGPQLEEVLERIANH